ANSVIPNLNLDYTVILANTNDDCAILFRVGNTMKYCIFNDGLQYKLRYAMLKKTVFDLPDRLDTIVITNILNRYVVTNIIHFLANGHHRAFMSGRIS